MRIRMTEVVQKSLLMAIAFAKMGHHEQIHLTKGSLNVKLDNVECRYNP